MWLNLCLHVVSCPHFVVPLANNVTPIVDLTYHTIPDSPIIQFPTRSRRDAFPFRLPKTFRIMLEPCEVIEGEEGLSVTLPAADSRTAHVRGVLKGESGESLRVGVVNAGR